MDGAEQVPGTVLTPSMPFLLNLTSALRSVGSVLQRNGEEKVTQPESLATQLLLDFFFFAPKQKRLQWATPFTEASLTFHWVASP